MYCNHYCAADDILYHFQNFTRQCNYFTVSLWCIINYWNKNPVFSHFSSNTVIPTPVLKHALFNYSTSPNCCCNVSSGNFSLCLVYNTIQLTYNATFNRLKLLLDSSYMLLKSQITCTSQNAWLYLVLQLQETSCHSVIVIGNNKMQKLFLKMSDTGHTGKVCGLLFTSGCGDLFTC